ncbi:MAG: tautomerase family protein [Betaproteobacteria bacterium]|nr:tautomerase family protein [Betaproteobacteria bacterium]
MPLVTLTVLKPKTTVFKDTVLAAVHESLVSIGVPEADRFQRVLELPPEDFRFDRVYPDVQGRRSDDFVLIEIVLSVGRSVKVKKQFLAALLEKLKTAGLHPEDVMVVFKETTWENWAFAGGRQIHV